MTNDDILRTSSSKRGPRVKAGHHTLAALCNENWLSPIRNFHIQQLFKEKAYYMGVLRDWPYIKRNILNYSFRIINAEDAAWKVFEINLKLRRLLYGYYY